MAAENDPARGGLDEKTLKNAEFCKSKCPMCVGPREKGRGVLYHMLKIEAKVGICPYCNAYKKVYGVPAYEKPPA